MRADTRERRACSSHAVYHPMFRFCIRYYGIPSHRTLGESTRVAGQTAIWWGVHFRGRKASRAEAQPRGK